ncbi:MAG: hypothetical protein ACYDD6_02230, partial [Acidimicrobiales bacterium]
MIDPCRQPASYNDAMHWALVVQGRYRAIPPWSIPDEQTGSPRPQDVDGDQVGLRGFARLQLLDRRPSSRWRRVEKARDRVRVAVREEIDALDDVVHLGEPPTEITAAAVDERTTALDAEHRRVAG